MGIFFLQGYHIIQDKEQADVWLLNSCTVKNPAEEGGWLSLFCFSKKFF